VLGERPAIGTIKVRQILLAFPPGADDTDKKRVERLADSIYQALRKGSAFGELARLYSNDYISAANGGEMMEFGVGQFDPAFENKIISMTKDNELSDPFSHVTDGTLHSGYPSPVRLLISTRLSRRRRSIS
jgi:peptidyl-prolyl cis-trans isomerase SurA